MLCEHYKDALIEAAASGVAPQSELRAHLDACASCRAALAEEQSLFAAIDSGLHAAANSEVPAPLFPRVRTSLNEGALSQRNWLPQLVFASASVALILLFLLLLQSHHWTPEDVATKNPVTVATPVPHETGINPQRIPPAEITFAAPRPSRKARNSTNLHTVASSNPEVLVPLDEREAFSRFLSRDQQPAALASASADWAPKAPQESVEILPVEIASLKVKPLSKDEDPDQQTESQTR